MLVRGEERLDHLRPDEVAVELVELPQPEVVPREVPPRLRRLVRVPPQVPVELHQHERPATPDGAKAITHFDGARVLVTDPTGKQRMSKTDALGRPLVVRQYFKTGGVWGSAFESHLAYNLAGGVTSQTYPSGRAVSYQYDAAGRLNRGTTTCPTGKSCLPGRAA